MSDLPFVALGERSGFLPDPRFVPGLAQMPEPAAPEDPVARAREEGYAAGHAEAEARAIARAEVDAAARTRITLSLARLDAEQAEALRQKLYATVEALCEASLAPFALDREALAARVAKAAAMLARADDDKVLRLHPEDFRLIANDLPEELDVLEDPILERGSLRIETSSGGVEDGPAHWHRAIAEALARC